MGKRLVIVLGLLTISFMLPAFTTNLGTVQASNNQGLYAAVDMQYEQLERKLKPFSPATNLERDLRRTCKELSILLKDFQNAVPICEPKIAYWKSEVTRIKTLLRDPRITSDPLKVQKLQEELKSSQFELNMWVEIYPQTLDRIATLKKAMKIKNCP